MNLLKYKSDNYNALNYCIHKIKYKGQWYERHTGNKDLQSIRLTLWKSHKRKILMELLLYQKTKDIFTGETTKNYFTHI